MPRKESSVASSTVCPLSTLPALRALASNLSCPMGTCAPSAPCTSRVPPRPSRRGSPHYTSSCKHHIPFSICPPLPASAQGGEEGRLVDAAQPRRQRVHVRRAQGGGDIGRARAGLPQRLGLDLPPARSCAGNSASSRGGRPTSGPAPRRAGAICPGAKAGRAGPPPRRSGGELARALSEEVLHAHVFALEGGDVVVLQTAASIAPLGSSTGSTQAHTAPSSIRSARARKRQTRPMWANCRTSSPVRRRMPSVGTSRVSATPPKAMFMAW